MFRRSVLLSVASMLALSTVTACAADVPKPDAGIAHDWSFESVEDGIRSLALAERELDLLLVQELGIDEATGVSADEAADWLPRAGAVTAAPAASVAPQESAPNAASATDATFVAAAMSSVSSKTAVGAVPAEYPVPDMETVGAAANSLSLLHDVLRDALGEASLNSTDRSAQYSSAEGQNPKITWSVEKGLAQGEVTSSISDTNEAGDSVTVAVEGMFEIHVCPNEYGAAEGAFFTTAAVTFTPKGGKPVRTAIDIDMETVAHVNDEAYAIDLWAKLDSAVSTGAPHPESATRVPDADSFRQEDNAYAFEFGDTGVQDRGEMTADAQLDGAFSAQVDDLAEQIALLMARAAEDYWRDGNCVDVLIEGEDVNPDPGAKQQLWVDAVSLVDGSKITRGTVEVTKVLLDSSVNPTGPQPIAEADYQFVAGQQIGKADPDFEVVTRRGIGRAGTGITVGVDAWTINQSFAGANYVGKSCDGIHGPWWIDVTVPEIAETWGTELMFDQSLRSYFTKPPTNGGSWVHPDEQFWLEPSGDDYILHNELGGDAALRMTRADPSVCSE